MDMPTEAQMLYIRLNMAADDDGFCDNPRSIMRACGAGNDVMKILIKKKFVLTFQKEDNFVVVIKHWRMNNYIRKDNYRETKYKEFMRDLYYDENKSYSLNPGDGHVPVIPGSSPNPVPTSLPDGIQTVDESYTDRIQTVDESLTQDRIGKDSIGKVSIDQDSIGESEGKQGPDDKIHEWARKVKFFSVKGWDPHCMYSLAEKDGVSRDAIDMILQQEDLT
jgi:hypothetical protein